MPWKQTYISACSSLKLKEPLPISDGEVKRLYFKAQYITLSVIMFGRRP